MDFSLIIDSLPIYFDGLWTTVWLVLSALIIGLGVAIPLAVARNSANYLLSLRHGALFTSSVVHRYWFSFT